MLLNHDAETEDVAEYQPAPRQLNDTEDEDVAEDQPAPRQLKIGEVCMAILLYQAWEEGGRKKYTRRDRMRYKRDIENDAIALAAMICIYILRKVKGCIFCTPVRIFRIVWKYLIKLAEKAICDESLPTEQST